jgi:hypothetical protein
VNSIPHLLAFAGPNAAMVHDDLLPVKAVLANSL